MDDLVFVHVVQGPADLADDVPGHVLGDSPPLLEVAVELARYAELHGQVDEGIVREEAVHLDDVGVVQEHLDLYLPQQLDRQLAVDLGLLDLLQSAHQP